GAGQCDADDEDEERRGHQEVVGAEPVGDPGDDDADGLLGGRRPDDRGEGDHEDEDRRPDEHGWVDPGVVLSWRVVVLGGGRGLGRGRDTHGFLRRGCGLLYRTSTGRRVHSPREGPSSRRGQTGASPRLRPARPRRRRASVEATSRSTVAPGESGAARTTGVPASPPSRTATSSGTCPRRGTSLPTTSVSRAETCSPPPSPNTARREPSGCSSHDMFSTTPTTPCEVCVATDPARSATSAAAACGVVTTGISEPGSSCATEIAMSPVPGGRSRSSTSRSPQKTSARNCSSARCSIGPRQTTG